MMIKTVIGILTIFAIILAGIFIFKNMSHLNTDIQDKNKHAPKTIYIGWIGPLTGPASIIGIDNLNSVKLAFSEYEAKKTVNDPQIKLVVADNKDETENSIAEYKKIIRTVKPVAIFLNTHSAVKALAKYASQDSVILIDPIDNDSILSNLNHNIFLIAKETEQLAGIDADAIISHGKTNTLIIYNADDEFMGVLAKTMQEILSSTGRNLSHVISYGTGTHNFQPFLQLAKEKNIDSYVFFGYQEIGLAMKQARDMGITAPFYSVNVITDPILQKNSEGSVNGTYFSHFTKFDGNIVKADEFIDKYVARYGIKPQPEWVAMQAYDTTNILISAIRQSLPNNDNKNIVENISENLRQVTEYEGVSGNITIKPNGASKGIYPNLYQIQDGLPIKLNPYGKISRPFFEKSKLISRG